MIGVTGIATRLPLAFPLTKAENSGNLVHGTAPFRMFKGAHFSVDRAWEGQRDFRQFVNESCSHAVFTQANLLRLGDTSDAMRARYRAFQDRLEGYDKPIVVLGLGAQSRTDQLKPGLLPPEAISLMKHLGEHCELISVRGEFTAKVFKHYAGVENTFVTGCPSFYSRPEAFGELRQRLANAPEVFAYSATELRRENEVELLARALGRDAHYIEPANPVLHRFHLDLVREPGTALPTPLRTVLERWGDVVSEAQVRAAFSTRYHLFRSMDPWFDFNHEYVDFTYGPRFHVNMASMLSGVPALWLVHDSRTRELARALRLPSLETEAARHALPDDLAAYTNFTEMFDHLHGLFARFNEFLSAVGLPKVTLTF